ADGFSFFLRAGASTSCRKQSKRFPSLLAAVTDSIATKSYSGREKVVALEPPAKPLDTELKVVTSEIQISQVVVVESQPPPKPPDVGQSVMARSRRERRPNRRIGTNPWTEEEKVSCALKREGTCE
ncbi:hypothetical protein L195_g041063, partial [Trifolium pratense]